MGCKRGTGCGTGRGKRKLAEKGEGKGGLECRLVSWANRVPNRYTRGKTTSATPDDFHSPRSKDRNFSFLFFLLSSRACFPRSNFHFFEIEQHSTSYSFFRGEGILRFSDFSSNFFETNERKVRMESYYLRFFLFLFFYFSLWKEIKGVNFAPFSFSPPPLPSF